jgi:quercetin dioxygenase-like cupin family protein
MERPTPGVLAQVDHLVRGALPEQGGALWRLSEGQRQLDANVVRLPPRAVTAEHVEPDVDVLMCVAAGSGSLDTDSGPQDLVTGSVAWLPHGTPRALVAGPEGLVYLTVHRRRGGMTIRFAAQESEGGEAACQLGRVCVNCGRLGQEADARFCGRCGEPLPTG